MHKIMSLGTALRGQDPTTIIDSLLSEHNAQRSSETIEDSFYIKHTRCSGHTQDWVGRVELSDNYIWLHVYKPDVVNVTSYN